MTRYSAIRTSSQLLNDEDERILFSGRKKSSLTAEIYFCVAENFGDCLAVRTRQRDAITLVLFVAGQHLVHAAQNGLLDQRRKRVESWRIDQIAAGVLHQTPRQI